MTSNCCSMGRVKHDYSWNIHSTCGKTFQIRKNFPVSIADALTGFLWLWSAQGSTHCGKDEDKCTALELKFVTTGGRVKFFPAVTLFSSNLHENMARIFGSVKILTNFMCANTWAKTKTKTKTNCKTLSANSSICLRLGALWSSIRTRSTLPWKNDVSYVFSLHKLNIMYLREGKDENIQTTIASCWLSIPKPVFVLGVQESRHLFNWVPRQDRGLRARINE